jgi:hypothetical protein
VRPLPGTPAYCPYCYEEISRQQAWFRCTGRISPQGRRCAPEVDEVLRSHTGYTGALPPPFAARGRPGSADCPECGGDTTIRICPVCHSRLPIHFGRVRSHLIVPVGGKEAGKTVFMTVLIHELMHRAGQRLNAAIIGADDDTRKRFSTDYERPLYRDADLLGPTQGAGEHKKAPLVFRFTNETRRVRSPDGRPGRKHAFGSGEPQHTLLSFFDAAGEDLASQQSVAQGAAYLTAADSIILLLDPLQMRDARDLARPGTQVPATGEEPAAVLENITGHFLSMKGKRPGQPISKPLAIVFTKMDAFWHDLEHISPLRRLPAHGAHFDERDSLYVHNEIQRLLIRWDGARIDRIARENYSSYRYFGVSALGEAPMPEKAPAQEKRVSPRGIRPYRVTDPFLWLLARYGIIPVK